MKSQQGSLGDARTTSQAEEIALRKARRRLRKMAAAFTVCLFAALLAAVGVWYGTSQHQIYKQNVATLTHALEVVDSADTSLLALDEAVSDPFSYFETSQTGQRTTEESFVRLSANGAEESVLTVSGETINIDASALQEIQVGAADATLLLEAAQEEAAEASEGLNTSEDKEAANQTLVAISARQRMISAALEALESAQTAEEAAQVAQLAWDCALDADGAAREAAQLVSAGSDDDIKACQEKTEEANKLFDQALYLLQQAEYVYDAVDFSEFVTYIEKRQEALSYASASNTALLNDDTEEASTQNEAYETADTEAVELAKSLPNSPSDVVYQAYEDRVSSARSAYETARKEAGTADAVLRDYLGV